MNQNPSPTLYSVSEFAAALGLSNAAIYKRIHMGQLHAMKDAAGRFWIDAGELAALAAASQRKHRRTITTSPRLSALIEEHLGEYGDISALFESGAWVMFVLRGNVPLQEALDHLSLDTIRSLKKICGT